MKMIKILCFCLFLQQFIFASQTEIEYGLRNSHNEKAITSIKDKIESLCRKKKNKDNCCSKTCQLADVGFSVTSPTLWYEIVTPVYPATVPLSLHRNRGIAQGEILFTDEGLVIERAGNYSFSFTAIVTNMDPTYTPFIPIFLVKNGVFDPLSTTTLGSVGTVPYEFIATIQGTGILQNVEAGTALSLVATNGGSPEPEPITVIGWGISTFRIPCDSDDCEIAHQSSSSEEHHCHHKKRHRITLR